MKEDTPRRFFIYTALSLLSCILVFTPAVLPSCLYENFFLVTMASAGIIFGLRCILGMPSNLEVAGRLLKRLAILTTVMNIGIVWFFALGPAASPQTYYTAGTIRRLSSNPYSLRERYSLSVYLDESIRENGSSNSRDFAIFSIPRNACIFRRDDGRMLFADGSAIRKGRHIVVIWKKTFEFEVKLVILD